MNETKTRVKIHPEMYGPEFKHKVIVSIINKTLYKHFYIQHESSVQSNPIALFSQMFNKQKNYNYCFNNKGDFKAVV